MKLVLFFIGLLLSADGLGCAMMTSMGIGEAIVVAMGIIFILWGVFRDEINKNGFFRFIKRIFAFCMIIFVAYSVTVCLIGRNDTATYREDYVVVLGAGLSGDEPSLALEKRLDKAIEYLNRNNDAKVIVSGGQGDDEKITEALAMYNYLVQSGIAPERIAQEEKATSTYENFMYSKEFMEEGTAVFITNDFHVVRSTQMAELNGMEITHIAAPTPLALLPLSCAREMVAQIAALRYYIP